MLPIEQIQPPILNEEDRYGSGMPLHVPEGSGLNGFAITDTSFDLNRVFDLDFTNEGEPSAKAIYRLDFATLFLGESSETESVVEFFTHIAKKMNTFVAMPPDLVKDISQGRIRDYDMKRATEEGYLRRIMFVETDVELVELTAKLGEIFKTPKVLKLGMENE